MDVAHEDKPIFKNHCSIIHEGKPIDFEDCVFKGYWGMIDDKFGDFDYKFHRVLDE